MKVKLYSYWLKYNRDLEQQRKNIFNWLKSSEVKHAIWHSWAFEGWYWGVPYGTLKLERVKHLQHVLDYTFSRAGSVSLTMISNDEANSIS